MYKNNIRHLAISIALLTQGAMVANAAVSEEEAARLGNELTPMGAERAGNEDGAIPEWTGGFTDVPAGFEQGDRSQNPFADDEPLYTITAENLDDYKDKLADGVIQLFKDNPDTFEIHVYPTRRTAAAPQYVYDNTRENATRATLINDGLTVEGAYGGVPFPMPATGLEVHWNHLTRWRGVANEGSYKVWTTTGSGSRNLATAAENIAQYPYYYEDESYETLPDAKYMLAIQLAYEPAFRAGEALMVHDVLDYDKGRVLWQYLAGQRRVRQAPSINFDTPNVVASGVNFVDETFGGIGSPERFDWKLIGKREMIIPYNNNELLANPDETVMGDHHIKPEYLRWELHRVWVVEATVKKDSRHAVPKRKYYYDEDTWGTAILDGWDADGKLWRTTLSTPFAAPDIPATVNHCNSLFHDHRTKDWLYSCSYGDTVGEQYRIVDHRPESFFSPQSLLRMSGR